MDYKIRELSKISENLSEEYPLASSLIADIVAFLDGDLLDTKWIEKKAVALSLGKKLGDM